MSTIGERCETHWRDEIAAYALGVLDEREAALLEHHLERCPGCSERLEWLMPAVDMIPIAVPRIEPPPELRTRLMDIVREEETDERTTAAKSKRHYLRLPVFGRIALRPALATFGLIIVLAAGVTGYMVSVNANDTRTVEAVAENAPGASGSLEVDGDAGTLNVSNLPAARKDEVYQAWIVRDNKRKAEPSSVFVLSNDGTGSASIDHGLEGASAVLVTREPKGGSDVPHEGPLISAELKE